MNSSPRILLIAPTCDGTDVGEAWSTYQWVSRLSSRYRVTVLTYSKRGRPSAASQLPGVDVVEWQDWPIVGRFERFNSGAKPGYIGFYLKARAWLKRELRHRRFDLIHQLSPLALRYPCPATGFRVPTIIGPLGGSLPTPSGFASEMNGSAWYTRMRALDRMRLLHDPMLRRSYEGADVVLGVAPYVRRLLDGLAIRRFEIISETGVATLPAQDGSLGHLRSRSLHLLFVGRIVRAKGVRDAIRALGHLRDCPEVVLDIVGEGDDLADCRKEVEQLQLTGRVFFHGRVPRAQVDAYYRRADALLFPSLREPSGNVVLEALGHGLPAIVADNGGPASAVDESCGICVSPISPTQYAVDLAAAIRRLAQDPTLLANMRISARQRASELFLWARKTEWMCSLYADLSSSPPLLCSEASRAASSMISVIIPAHNEEQVIGRLIGAFMGDAKAGEIEIIVVCNGCTDRTAEVARRYDGPEVVETPVASKVHALNLGDEAAGDVFPRFYLDADVVISGESLKRMAAVLESGAALAVAPTVRHDLAGASWAVRAFYDIDGRLPSRREGIGGSGVYGLSSEGRGRWGEFPKVTADDGFVRLQFAPHERLTVADAFSVVTPPRRLAGVIAIKTRSHFGTYELFARCPELKKNVGCERNGPVLRKLALRPWLWAKLGVYGYVKVVARVRARKRIRTGEMVWERDETSRRPQAVANV